MSKLSTCRLLNLTLIPLMFCSAVQAEELQVSVEVPRLQVAEYHNPYIAIWLENERNEATQLAVWYHMDLADNQGLEWLKDMRQWWRRGGRSLDLPLDGLSSATRGPGVHRVMFSIDEPSLAELAPGNYRLRIEASREVGGREILEIPLQWPAQEVVEAEVSGSSELGRVAIRLEP